MKMPACRICGNSENNKLLKFMEKQFNFNEAFPYFHCTECDCIQILEFPTNIERYYPSDYYSFNKSDGNEYLEKKPGLVREIQADYLIYNKNKLAGRLLTIGYKTPKLYEWIRNLKLEKDDRILDIGCGTGVILKQMYSLGYKNLLGVDPFIHEDYIISDSFRILKKDVLDVKTDDQEKFDCIMMHHSFEHMEFELEVLVKVKQILKPGGRILIRIPIVSHPLFNRYKENLVSLEAPRHFFIHSSRSMNIICNKAGLKVQKTVYDADAYSFWASEQYEKGISLISANSYSRSKKESIFSKSQIRKFKSQAKKLNEEGKSDAAAFYISVA